MALSNSEDTFHLKITLFGGLSVRQDNGPQVELSSPQSGALLAYLALNSQYPQSREVLIALLWPDSELEKGRQNLRQCLHSLRDLLEQPPFAPGSVLLTNRTSIHLNLQIVTTDVSEFERALDAVGRSGERTQRIQLLHRAIELYRGELLPGFYQDGFVLEQHRLAQRQQEALGQMIAEWEAAGAPRQAMPYAHRVLVLDPLSEEAHCALMRLYAAMEQPDAVQRQYQELEARLQRELGAGPREETRLLARRLQAAVRRQAACRPETEYPVATEANGTALSVLPASEEASGPRLDDSTSILPATPLPAPSVPRPGWRLAVAMAGLALLLALVRQAGLSFSKETPASIGAGRGRAGSPPIDPLPSSDSQDAPWSVRYELHPGEAATGGSEPTAMTVDPAGNIYITGFVHTIQTDVDYLTLKYSPKGELLWKQSYNGPGNDLDRANAIAVDSAGNVYVTGESDGGKGHGPERLSGCDIATVKYGPDGRQLWAQRYAGPADGMDSGRKIALDSAGNVVVFGQSWGGDPKEGGTGADLILIQYDAAGNEKWHYRFAGGAVGPDAAVDMLIGAGGNIYFLGRMRGPNNTPTLVTVKCDPNGKRKWEDEYLGTEGMGAAPTCMVQNGFGDIYVIGHETFAVPRGLGPGEAYLILKYDTTGKRLWSKPTTYRWPGYSYRHFPTAAAVDGRNDLYVTGKILCESSSPGCGTLKIAADGAIGWADPYRSTGHTGHFATAMGVNSLGEIFTAGWGSFLDPITPVKDTLETAVLEFACDRPYSVRDVSPQTHRLGVFGGIAETVLIAIDRKDNVIVSWQSAIDSRGEITTAKYRP